MSDDITQISTVYATTEQCYDCEYVDCHGDKCRKMCRGKEPFKKHCTACYGSEHYQVCRDCTIFDCYGSNCGLRHSTGFFIHCKSCSGYESHTNEPVRLPSKGERETLLLINCKGDGCRIHHRHNGRGIVHCIWCFPVEKTRRESYY